MPGASDEAVGAAESPGLQRGQRGLRGAPPLSGDDDGDDTKDDYNDDDDNDDIDDDDDDDDASLPSCSTRWAAPW